MSGDGCAANPKGPECECEKIALGDAWKLALGSTSLVAPTGLSNIIWVYLKSMLTMPFAVYDMFKFESLKRDIATAMANATPNSAEFNEYFEQYNAVCDAEDLDF